MLLVEDLKPLVTLGLKLKFFLITSLLPYVAIKRYFISSVEKPNDIATVLFSSGSTGEPKGIMLSHANILSNLEGIFDIVQLNKKDALVGILPFFHSFGFTATLWLPLLANIRVAYHYNPMEAETVGSLCKKIKGTFLLATPTFLMNYVRRCSVEQLKTLRFVLAGAEKLKASIAKAFYEKFGIMPLEGYGCSELSPIAMFNIPDFRDPFNHQIGNKLGTVGHPLPGLAVRIVDPDSMHPLPVRQEGMLQVKGPNVMIGYLGDEKKTNEAIVDGWYTTGDIAMLDDDGFVKITDRLSRFSKIGGEMVPHILIEDHIHSILGTIEQECVVCGLSDERKGEKLIVLHKIDFDVQDLIRRLAKVGLPNLWIPKKDSFIKVEAFPILGSGKLDLRAIKELGTRLYREKSDLLAPRASNRIMDIID